MNNLSIPEKFKIDRLIHQKTYLVNGELKSWNFFHSRIQTNSFGFNTITRGKAGYGSFRRSFISLQ